MDGVYSGPGRVVAVASDSEYIERDKAKERWVKFVDSVENQRAKEAGVAPSFFQSGFFFNALEPRFFCSDRYDRACGHDRNSTQNRD